MLRAQQLQERQILLEEDLLPLPVEEDESLEGREVLEGDLGEEEEEGEVEEIGIQ